MYLFYISVLFFELFTSYFSSGIQHDALAMSSLSSLFASIPIFEFWFNISEMRTLKCVCKELFVEMEYLIQRRHSCVLTEKYCNWSRLEQVVTLRDGWEPDQDSSIEMINLLKDFIFAQWPYSTEMRHDYQLLAYEFQILSDNHASPIYQGARGLSGGAIKKDTLFDLWPCQPSLQVYYTLNCLGERNQYSSRSFDPPPGVLECFKILFQSSVQTSDIIRDYCGWDEAEYLLSATILSCKIPEPGRVGESHSRFNYEAQCDLHPSFMNPGNTCVYNFMYDLFEYIATCKHSREWQLLNFISVLKYVSNRKQVDLNSYRDSIAIPIDVIIIQRKVVSVYCYALRNHTLEDSYQLRNLSVGLKHLISKNRTDILTIIFEEWFSFIDVPPTYFITPFLCCKQSRVILISCLWNCPIPFIVNFFFELLKRRERVPIESLWLLKKDILINAVDEDGNDAILTISGVRGRVERIAEFLIQNGAAVDSKNNFGQTALDRAAAIRNKTMMGLLSEHINESILITY